MDIKRLYWMTILPGLLLCRQVLLVSTKTPPTTTPPTTTPPTTPRGDVCKYQGRWYPVGEIERDANNCYGAICESGGSIYQWDDKCFLVPQVCHGREEQVPGQCCKLCITTTTPITTTPPTTTPPTTVPPGDGCDFNGKWYPVGEIERDANKCYGTMCESGGNIINWDDRCFLDPPVCHGIEEDVPGQCCKRCITTTTPTTTTTVPVNDCWYNGTLHRNYDRFDLSEDGCSGKECHYGAVQAWSHVCAAVENCNGTTMKPPGECCEVCMPPEGGCYYNGRVYKYNEKVNVTDPCHPCMCFESGEVHCAMFKCDTTDCSYPYREEGACCYTCGSTKMFSSSILMLVTLAALITL